MKNSKKLSRLLTLVLALSMMASMMAVNAFSAAAEDVPWDETEWDDQYTVEFNTTTYEGSIPKEIYDDFLVYKWDKTCKTVEGSQAVLGPFRPDDKDPDAGDPNRPYVHATYHGEYQNGYLDFYHVISSKAFSGLTYNNQEVVNFKLELEYYTAWARRAIMIGPKGEFAVSDDEDPTNDKGIIIFLEVEGRLNVAGAIDPASAKCTNPDVIFEECEKDDFPKSPNFRATTYLPEKYEVTRYGNVKQVEHPTLCIEVKDGVLTIYDKLWDDSVFTVNLTEQYQGGYITLLTNNIQQGSWVSFSVKKEPYEPPAHTEHDFGEWEVTKEPTFEEPGEERRECSGCDEFETREIPQLVGDIWFEFDGKWYYIEANGELAFSKWIKSDGKWYFLGDEGYMLTNKWQKDSKGWVKLGADGAMLTNAWTTDSKGWCFVGADGYAVTNCWKKDSKGWIWLNDQGSMTKSKWVLDGGKWYYLDAAGYMVTNKWSKDSKGWVYVGADGAMLTNAWCKDSKGWCYVGANGYAVTNTWKKDSKGWIYLNGEGSMTKAKWVKDGGKWYYCDAAGYMVAGKSVKIGNKTYNFNASGVCTNP